MEVKIFSLSWQLVVDITHRAGELYLLVNLGNEALVPPADVVYSQMP